MSTFDPDQASLPGCADTNRNGDGWYCLQARPKHEHIAAASLRSIDGVSTICPRIRFRKQTRRGPVWFVEAVFPGYLFARFDFESLHRQVRYSNGVMTIVHFGGHVPRIEDGLIEVMRSRFAHAEVIVIEPDFGIGDQVTLTSGVFAGLEAVVTRVIPARERINVLLDILGRQLEAEISQNEVILVDALRQHPFC